MSQRLLRSRARRAGKPAWWLLALGGATALCLGGCEVMMSDDMRWPAGVDQGINYAAWTPGGYATPESHRSLEELAATGASHVAIVVTGYMADTSSSEVFWHDNRTPTEESLRAALGRARELGLRTVLKPHVDVLGGAYRGFIDPTDRGRWFDSYETLMLRWAEIAEQEGCESFWIGTELESMSHDLARWRRLITALRERFSGSLVYAANWTDLEEPDTLALGSLVDALGVDAYFPVADVEQPTVTDLMLGWQPWLLVIEEVARQTGRPIIITEVGCPSRRGAAIEPWNADGDAPIDQEHQARYYEATLRALSSSDAIKGIYFWAWGVGEGGPSDGRHTPRGKPAADVLRRFWAQRGPI